MHKRICKNDPFKSDRLVIFEKVKPSPNSMLAQCYIPHHNYFEKSKPLKTMGTYVEFYVRDVCHYNVLFFPARREQAI